MQPSGTQPNGLSKPGLIPFYVSLGDDSRVPAVLAVVHAPRDRVAADRLAGSLLSGEEIARYERFRVDHARHEFLAGRLAAKSALASLHPGSRPADWRIIRGNWQQPCVRGPAAGFAVTLAHADGLALAVAFDDRWQCGIDVEGANRAAEDVIEREVSPDEWRWARADTTPGQLRIRSLLLWTAREATGKFLRTGLLLPAALPPSAEWRPTPIGWTATCAGCDLVGIHGLVTNEYVISLAAPRSFDASGLLLPLRPLLDAQELA